MKRTRRSARVVVSGPSDPSASTTLFCFPFAGGSATAYRMWYRDPGGWLRVSAVEYPGHGRRLAEEPLRSVPLLVTDLTDHLTEHLEKVTDGAFAFFGHSMGGVVAYEVARELRRRGRPGPGHLFVSGVGAPGAPPPAGHLLDLSDEDVIDHMRTLGGTPSELFRMPGLLDHAVRVLRADSVALGSYRHRPGASLRVPLTVFGGAGDTLVPAAALRGWRHHTQGPFRLRLFPGDHFYLFPAAREVMGAIATALDGPTPAPGPDLRRGPAQWVDVTASATEGA